MITKSMWRAIIDNIKDIKYIKLTTNLNEKDLTVFMLFTIIGTPITILLDILLTPFYILYFVIYKILWRTKC